MTSSRLPHHFHGVCERRGRFQGQSARNGAKLTVKIRVVEQRAP